MVINNNEDNSTLTNKIEILITSKPKIIYDNIKWKIATASCAKCTYLSLCQWHRPPRGRAVLSLLGLPVLGCRAPIPVVHVLTALVDTLR